MQPTDPPPPPGTSRMVLGFTMTSLGVCVVFAAIIAAVGATEMICGNKMQKKSAPAALLAVVLESIQLGFLLLLFLASIDADFLPAIVIAVVLLLQASLLLLLIRLLRKCRAAR